MPRRVRVVQLSPEDVDRQLSELEKRFGMSSAEFLRKYRGDELEHRGEFVEWAALLRSRIKTSEKALV
jgi:hypothetical protein